MSEKIKEYDKPPNVLQTGIGVAVLACFWYLSKPFFVVMLILIILFVIKGLNDGFNEGKELKEELKRRQKK